MPPVENLAPASQQPIQVSGREEDSMNKEPSMSGQQIVGLIIPPPDIRSLLKYRSFKTDIAFIF